MGNAAVDAHIVSPAVLIAVAIAGVAGYTMPSQDFGNALRLWRFGLTVLSSLGGLFGLVLGCVALLYHLAGLAKERGIPGGFLHVPCCCEQVLDKPGCPSLPLPAITAGLEAALGVIAESLRKG